MSRQRRCAIAFSATVLAMLVAAPGCNAPWTPLDAPLPSSHRVSSGLRLAVAGQDLPQVGETIRVLAGKQVEFAAAPAPIGATGHQRSAIAGALELAEVQASWNALGALQVEAKVGKLQLPLSIGKSGAASCALKWLGNAGKAKLSVRLAPAGGGQVQAELVDAPQLLWKDAGFAAGEACLAPLGDAASQEVDQEIRQVLADALLPRLASSSLHALRTAFPGQLAVAGQTPVGHVGSSSLNLRIHNAYADAPGGSLVQAGAGMAVAQLDVAVDVDRHPCAVDAPPPQLAALAKLQPTQVPPADGLLRRGINLDSALLAHLTWSWARAGGWCRQTPLSGSTQLSLQWLQEIAPDLADWLDSAPTAVRLWPHASPQVSVIDWQDAPGLLWTVADATLEIIAPVGGAEAVVLTLRGRLRGVLRPTIGSGGKVQLVQVQSAMDSAVVSSPLLGDAVAAGGSERLAQVVHFAVKGISEPAAVLPLEAVLPAGTVATSVTRTGESLWLWLDGGLQPSAGL